MSNTYIYKGLLTEVKKSELTIRELNNIKKAIVDICDNSLRWLMLTGKVVSFNLRGKKMYMYRLNRKERIIFNIENGKRIIYDIVSTDSSAKTNRQKDTLS